MGWRSAAATTATTAITIQNTKQIKCENAEIDRKIR